MAVETMQKQRTPSILPIMAMGSTVFPAGTGACALLGRLVRQDRSGEETPFRVAGGRGARKLESKFSLFLDGAKGSICEGYRFAQALLFDQDYSKKDISDFVNMLRLHQNHDKFTGYAGLFVSALLNSSIHNNFKLDLSKISAPMDCLLFGNSKDVEVYGNGGLRFGYCMKGGVVLLHGNTEEHLGDSMAGGTIVVDGCCGRWTGEGMNGGEIHIIGDADGSIGFLMRGGTIRVNGKLDIDTKSMQGGSIFRGDRLLVKDGTRQWGSP